MAEQNADEVVYTLIPQPGIKRDGTQLEGEQCSDGQWVRFQRGKAIKMNGYKLISDMLTGPVRKILLWSRKDLNLLYSFSESKIESLLLNNELVGNDVTNRTPAGFTTSTKHIWSADTQYDEAVGTAGTIVVAHCSSSMENMDDDTATKPVWALASSSSSQFDEIDDAPAVSGGVFCIAPYTICYGSDGFVSWSDANQPQVWSTSTIPGDAGADRVTGSKIVAGLPLRAGRLAGLLWSLDSLIRMDYVGGNAIWSFAHISTQSSILSQNSVIEYDGVYYWIGVDRFMMYDSTLHELPNDLNQNWFFNHLNYQQRQKVWATKVPRYGEIWWFYPRDSATECTHAVIYNIRQKTWYDVELGRGAGYYSQVRQYPVWISSTKDYTANYWIGGGPEGGGEEVIEDRYGLYQHEYGQNAIIGDVEIGIYSSYTTQNFGLPTGGVADSQQGSNRWTRLTRVEPDFVQGGYMTCEVLTNEFAHSTTVTSDAHIFTYQTEKIDLREQGRHIRLRFTNNTLNGNFEAGKVLVHTEPGDNRS